MSVFEIVEPSLAWPKSARIGFYGLRQHRRPSPSRCRVTGSLFVFFLQISPRGALGTFFSPLEASKSAFGELLARKSRAGGGQGAPGGLRGRFLDTYWLPKRCFVLFFSSFRGMAFFACIWTVFCSTFFLFEGCSRSARKRRTRRLYHKNQCF